MTRQKCCWPEERGLANISRSKWIRLRLWAVFGAKAGGAFNERDFHEQNRPATEQIKQPEGSSECRAKVGSMRPPAALKNPFLHQECTLTLY
jgi:hypothetical protein